VFLEARTRELRGQKTKVLKKFSRFEKTAYSIVQTSPDGRYLMVRAEVSDQWCIYIIVDITTGKSRDLLVDKVPREAGSYVSRIRWVE